MRDNDSGSEQHGDWQPPEYVSPWTPAPDPEPRHDTISFGTGQESAEKPAASPGYGTGEYGRGAAAGSPGAGDAGLPGAPGNPGEAGYGNGGYGGGGYGDAGYGGAQYPPGGYGGYGMGEPPPPRGPRVGRFLVYAVVAVLAAGAGAGAAVALGHNSGNNSPGISSRDLPQPQNAAPNSGAGARLNQQAIARKVDPGVVDITSTLRYSQETAEGTGMVLSPDGLVLTNNHVIDDSTKVTATLVVSGRTYHAQVLGYDSTDDVALLKLTGASGLATVRVGNSSAVRLGDPVLALGNAQGRGGMPSLAPGIINALDRNITASDQGSAVSEKLYDMLQTNAPIQEGDSGGPLVNASGQVVGMDTAANSQQSFGQSSGTIGFAIPINRALSIARNIADGHASSTVHIGLAGFIGIGVVDISQAAQCGNNGFGGGSGGQTAPVNSGALVCNVYPGTPAARSGLAPGDVIVEVDGQQVTDGNALTGALAGDHPGQRVAITYVGLNGARHNASIELIAGAK